jgi:multicomponent Na+:H+ antiporter subunit D
MVVPVLILVLSGLLNVGYFFPIIWRAYFKPGDPGLEKHGEASPFMVVPIMVTAVLSVLLGMFPDLFFHFFELASAISNTIFNGGT